MYVECRNYFKFDWITISLDKFLVSYWSLHESIGNSVICYKEIVLKVFCDDDPVKIFGLTLTLTIYTV